jgi:sterol desaturase/sphingolipid hydroxylase (fatty acid hydroxylase superfamily)
LRFHPINRFSTTLADFGFLLVLGFPEYALVASVFVRHYYGYLIHADLPWTFGKFGYVFVSPVMHQWHHARDPAAYRSNFATVFSIIDRLFGTFRVPGLCKVPLGVNENMGEGFVGQLKYPFRLTSYSGNSSDAVPSRRKTGEEVVGADAVNP